MTDDPYLWLEDVTGDEALDWVRARNEISQTQLESDPDFEPLRADLLAIMDSQDKIPYVAKQGEHYYNFWQDADNPRGIWRRTTPEEYRKPKPAWELLLDVDALNAAEDESWVFHGAVFLHPPTEGDEYELCLVSLSRGGSDADVTREFDLSTKRFVEDGFFRAESKGAMTWIDRDRVFIYTDFGAGTMTTSGYPRIVKEWRRGTALEDAVVVYEGNTEDMYIWAVHDQTRGYERDFVGRTIEFYNVEMFVRDTSGGLAKIDVPNSAKADAHREWLTIELRDPWTVGGQSFPAGALLCTNFDAFMAGERVFEVLFTPDERTSLTAYLWTRNHLILNVLEDVKSRVTVLTPSEAGWQSRPLDGAPDIGTVVAWAVDAEASDEFFMTTTDFVTPSRLWFGTIGSEPEVLKSMPAFFDATGLVVTQHFVASDDGTRVPYFLVAPEGRDGPIPTLLTGYGGFEVPYIPAYAAIAGRGWLSGGGAFAVANIRGGGEYGPRWHQAALKENRFRAYEDFAAVARDLIDRRVTTPQQLGITGGSNGGLLVGNMLTHYPDLFGAIVCQVPLLDMRRYNQLLAGASWMAEYGDPDKPEEWGYIQRISPYHNVRAGTNYPPVFFTTSTRDDRVHPGHARKMMARMEEQGHDVLYWENIEGGHGGAADNAQAALMNALEYTFLKRLFDQPR